MFALIDVIPDLVTCIIVLGFGLGYLIGNAGYNIDGEVKYGFGKEWYDTQSLFIQWIVGVGLDVFHHWEYGLLSIIIGYKFLIGDWQLFAWYFGWGFIISDLKDFENILIRLGLKEKPTPIETTTVTTEVSPTKTTEVSVVDKTPVENTSTGEIKPPA